MFNKCYSSRSAAANQALIPNPPNPVVVNIVEEIDLNAQEEITLFTDDEHVAVRTIDREFRQESKLKGIVREFTIFNGIQCYQKVTRKHGGKHKFRVNLACLDPEPRRIYNLADNWLIMGAIGLVLSFLLVYLGWFRTPPLQISNSLLYILTSVALSFSIIALLLALLKTRDRLVIYSKCGRAPVLELINNNPNKQQFMEFMDSLSRHILLSRRGISSSPTELLAMELKELRRLRDEHAIKEDQYESAKKRIFRNRAYNPDNIV